MDELIRAKKSLNSENGQELSRSVQVAGVKAAVISELGQEVGHGVQVTIEHKERDAETNKQNRMSHRILQAHYQSRTSQRYNQIFPYI